MPSATDRIVILLDEGVPEKLRGEFSSAFVVETVRYRGWAGKRNGELLALAETDFDALLTVDKRLRFQQNVAGRSIAVVVLDAIGTKFSDLLPLLPEAEEALRHANPGDVIVVAR